MWETFRRRSDAFCSSPEISAEGSAVVRCSVSSMWERSRGAGPSSCPDWKIRLSVKCLKGANVHLCVISAKTFASLKTNIRRADTWCVSFKSRTALLVYFELIARLASSFSLPLNLPDSHQVSKSQVSLKFATLFCTAINDTVPQCSECFWGECIMATELKKHGAGRTAMMQTYGCPI